VRQQLSVHGKDLGYAESTWFRDASTLTASAVFRYDILNEHGGRGQMTIQDYTSISTSVFTLITALFIGWQVRKMAESISLARLQNQHLLCLEVWKQYNDVFAERQDLLQNPIRLDEMLNRYPTVQDMVNSHEYKRLKRAAGVYVLAGALMESGAIAPAIIFQYISVPHRFWDDHWPLVQHLRANYYPNLWTHWELLVKSPQNKWLASAKLDERLGLPSRPAP
jgi:hypothetical protein